MSGVVYVPGVLKMAETKLPATRGKQRAEPERLMREAVSADSAQMAIYPDSSDPTWQAAHDAACAAGHALAAFAGPIVPKGAE